jgi:hypothetical protein
MIDYVRTGLPNSLQGTGTVSRKTTGPIGSRAAPRFPARSLDRSPSRSRKRNAQLHLAPSAADNIMA